MKPKFCLFYVFKNLIPPLFLKQNKKSCFDLYKDLDPYSVKKISLKLETNPKFSWKIKQYVIC